jgi:hypothetical protein
VALAAIPSAGSTFTGWSGACSGAGTCRMTLGSRRQVTAIFARAVVCAAAARSTRGRHALSRTARKASCAQAARARRAARVRPAARVIKALRSAASGAATTPGRLAAIALWAGRRATVR